METTRVKKYKAYRASITNGDAIKLEDDKDDRLVIDGKTKTLPLEEVIDTINEQNNSKKKLTKFEKKKITIIVLAIIGVILLAVLLVLLGIILWR